MIVVGELPEIFADHCRVSAGETGLFVNWLLFVDTRAPRALADAIPKLLA
jgi:hypothetical protein